MNVKQDEIKKVLLDMLVWFHNICKKNNLRYYALGGTMLGTARHQGFIPWDDDIDVGMPRKDYELLAKLLEKDTGGRYVLETPHSKAEDYFYTFSKIYDTHTTLVENTRARIKRGVYIDVFPLDGLANTEEESKKLFWSINWRFYFLLMRVGGIRHGRSPIKNFAVKMAQLIPNMLIDNKKLLYSIDALCREHDFDECKWGGTW